MLRFWQSEVGGWSSRNRQGNGFSPKPTTQLRAGCYLPLFPGVLPGSEFFPQALVNRLKTFFFLFAMAKAEC